jgi:hypothetical protein
MGVCCMAFNTSGQQTIFYTSRVSYLRDEFSRIYDIRPSLRLSGGLISLVNKGVLVKNKDIYTIDYRLASYIRRKAKLEYGFAVKQEYAKQ